MTAQYGCGRTPHGLWRVHRAMRSYKKHNKDWEWWNDPSKIDIAFTHYFCIHLQFQKQYSQIVQECAYRFIRRRPFRIRTVKDYNNLVYIICKRAGFGHQTRNASMIKCRDRAVITISGGWARPRFFNDEVIKRAKSIAKIREEKRRIANIKTMRSINETKAELTIIRAAIRSAQSAINGVKHENA